MNLYSILSLIVAAGSLSAATTYVSVDVPVTPFDLAGPGATSTLTVPVGGGVIADLDVGFTIIGVFASEIRVYLTSPMGTTVQLTQMDFVDGPTNSMNNAGGTIGFDDEVVNAMGSQAAAGTHTPGMGSLSAFDGESAVGVWTLTGVDGGTFTEDGDTLTGWSISVTTIPEPTVGLLVFVGGLGMLRRKR